MPIGLFIKFIVFAGTIRVFTSSESAILATLTYTSVLAGLGLILGDRFLPVLFGSAIDFGLCYGYFRLLTKFKYSGLYWPLLVAGLFIPLWNAVFPIPF